jgi:hypothetical protein
MEGCRVSGGVVQLFGVVRLFGNERLKIILLKKQLFLNCQS